MYAQAFSTLSFDATFHVSQKGQLRQRYDKQSLFF